MDGITEQPVSPSDMQSPSRIWDFAFWSKEICLEAVAEGRFTTAEICQRIRSSQGGVDSFDVNFKESSECSDTDLEALGHAMHDLQGLEKLHIEVGLTDEKASVFLRHVAKASFRTLHYVNIYGINFRIPSFLAETQGFSFVRWFSLLHVKLDEDECRILGQVLQGHHRQDFTIHLGFCSFPSFKGYFVLVDAAIKSGTYLEITFSSVRDASIPDSASDSLTMNEESHCTFYNIYERNKAKYGPGRGLKGKDLENHCFGRAANQQLCRYRDLNSAGRWKLLSNEQRPTVRESVDVLCHDKVRNCTDYLFHFITMNPDIYAAAVVKND